MIERIHPPLRAHQRDIKDPSRDLDFSHGICPACATREFAGMIAPRGAAR